MKGFTGRQLPRPGSCPLWSPPATPASAACGRALVFQVRRHQCGRPRRRVRHGDVRDKGHASAVAQFALYALEIASAPTFALPRSSLEIALYSRATWPIDPTSFSGSPENGCATNNSSIRVTCRSRLSSVRVFFCAMRIRFMETRSIPAQQISHA